MLNDVRIFIQRILIWRNQLGLISISTTIIPWWEVVCIRSLSWDRHSACAWSAVSLLVVVSECILKRSIGRLNILKDLCLSILDWSQLRVLNQLWNPTVVFEVYVKLKLSFVLDMDTYICLYHELIPCLIGPNRSCFVRVVGLHWEGCPWKWENWRIYCWHWRVGVNLITKSSTICLQLSWG